MKGFEFEAAVCPVCREDDAEPWKRLHVTRREQHPWCKALVERDFTFVRCRSCGHHYMDPAPSDESLEAYYNANYFAADDTAKHNQGLRLSLADRFFYRLCRPVPPAPRSRVLEIGPGNAKHLLWLKEMGHEVSGVDLGRHERVHGAEDIDIEVGRPERWSVPSASVDMICCYWVLEHVKDTARLLSPCLDWLKPGGLLVIGVPNAKCPEAKWFGDHWHHAVIPDHVSQFTMDSAQHMLKREGFELVSAKYDLLSFDFQLSLWSCLRSRLGWKLPLDHALVKLASLPFAPLKSALGWSGLITLQARKPL